MQVESKRDFIVSGEKIHSSPIPDHTQREDNVLERKLIYLCNHLYELTFL